jgi:hypothetical protein
VQPLDGNKGMGQDSQMVYSEGTKGKTATKKQEKHLGTSKKVSTAYAFLHMPT